jgi:hypothetical protein
VDEDQRDEARLEGGVYRIELEFTPRLPVDNKSVTAERLLTYLPSGSKVTDVEAEPSRPWVRITSVIPAGSPAEALVAIGRALENLAIYIRQQVGRDPLDEQGWLLRCVLSPGHL